MTDAIVEKIMKMPSAPKVLDSLQHALEEEQCKREQFYRDSALVNKKVEFINGKAFVHSPSMKMEIDAVQKLRILMSVFCDKFGLGFVGANKMMMCLTRNDYEPDIMYFNENASYNFDDDDEFFPTADLVIEVSSPDTKKRDRGIKFEDYEEHGIEEYWIIDTIEKTVEQYHLRDERYALILKANDGEITSFVLKGFTIPIKAIFDKELNMKVLTQILAS